MLTKLEALSAELGKGSEEALNALKAADWLRELSTSKDLSEASRARVKVLLKVFIDDPSRVHRSSR